LAVTYTLVRRLFGDPTALLTAGWLAVSFWPVFYARVALRAISLPLVAGLFVYFLTRALEWGGGVNQGKNDGMWRDWLLAGLFLGGSLYTYMAARVLPLIVIVASAYHLAFYRSARRQWRGLLLMWVVAVVVSAPLVLWLLVHPGAEYRIAEIQKPLTRLLAGDPSQVWYNLVANLKSFAISGDPWPRQNLPGRPVFADALNALLFYVGAALALWHWREPRYGILLVWLVGSLGPSVATADPPSSIRDILALVVVFVLPALAVVESGRWLTRRLSGRWSRVSKYVVPVAALLPLAITGVGTARDYFWRWPQDSVVRFDYQADLTAVARRLRDLPVDTAVTVAGLSVYTMDGPSLALSSSRNTDSVRLCDTRETLVIPAGSKAEIYVPGVVPFDDDLRNQILEWRAIEELDHDSAYRRYYLADGIPPRQEVPNYTGAVTLAEGEAVVDTISFDGMLSYLGYRWVVEPSIDSEFATLLTYWQVESRPASELKVFAHLMRDPDTFVAQDDGLASPPSSWASGDLIIQKHVFTLPELDGMALFYTEVGVYDSATGTRLKAGASDRLLLPTIEATR
jgi:hypothetical protein